MQFNRIINTVCSVGTHFVNKLDFVVYKKHYDGLIKNVSAPQVNSKIKDAYLRKWRQLSKHCTDRDLRLFAPFIGESEDVLPENISHNIVEPILNPIKYRPYYEDKNMFDKILPQGSLPITFMRRIGNCYYDVNYRKIDNAEETFTEICCNKGGFVVKPTIGSSSGNGVRVVMLGDKMSFKELETECAGDIIIQELLRQHKSLSFFNPTSINTLRMLVYKSPFDGRAYVINCALRVGKKGSTLDNAHAGGLLVGVGDDGVLCSFAVDQYGKKYQQVNDIDLTDAHHEIPDFEKIKEFVCDIANHVTHHRLLSMDIAVCKGNDDEVRPICVEFNLSSLGTWAFQYTIKPALGDKTDEIIDYCKAHKKEAVKFFGMRN